MEPKKSEVKKKWLAARLKGRGPMAFDVHCYRHLLNLALTDTLTALGVIQSL